MLQSPSSRPHSWIIKELHVDAAGFPTYYPPKRGALKFLINPVWAYRGTGTDKSDRNKWREANWIVTCWKKYSGALRRVPFGVCRRPAYVYDLGKCLLKCVRERVRVDQGDLILERTNKEGLRRGPRLRWCADDVCIFTKVMPGWQRARTWTSAVSAATPLCAHKGITSQLGTLSALQWLQSESVPFFCTRVFT